MKKSVSGKKERDLNIAAVVAFAAPSVDTPPRGSVNTVLIVGEPLTLAVDRYAPRGASACRVTFGGSLTVRIASTPAKSGDVVTLGRAASIEVDGRRVSAKEYDAACDLTFLDADGTAVSVIELRLTVVRYALLCDADRDGKLDDAPAAPEWTWGSKGSGPILLVNNDRDVAHGAGPRRDRLDSRYGGPLDLPDLAAIAVRVEGPPSLSPEYELALQVSDAAAEKIRIFDRGLPTSPAVVEPGRPRAHPLWRDSLRHQRLP